MSSAECKVKTSEKPKALASCYDRYPAWLKQFVRFVLWKYRWDRKRGDWAKVPINARTRVEASSTDPSTWCGFDDALMIYSRTKKEYEGVGIVLGHDQATGLHLCGVDFDNVISDDGTILPWAAEDIRELSDVGHVEYSPSGTGVKVVCLGQVDPALRCKSHMLEGGGKVEVYGSGRYFTQTGRVLTGGAL